MPMLDPLATFLQRVLEAGDDVDPVTALSGDGAEVTDHRRSLAAQYTTRARDLGYIEDSGSAATGAGIDRVSVTPGGRQYLADLDL